MPSKKRMTRGRTGRSDAGAKGGRVTAMRHGRRFFSEIGRKGGAARGKRAHRGVVDPLAQSVGLA